MFKEAILMKYLRIRLVVKEHDDEVGIRIIDYKQSDETQTNEKLLYTIAKDYQEVHSIEIVDKSVKEITEKEYFENNTF